MLNISKQHIQEFELFELGGRLDVAHANELDALVSDSLADGCRNFLFDFNSLDYISSYGIRIFVKLMRAEAVVSIVVTSDSVYEIFEMGALIEPLNIKRDLIESIKIFTQSNKT